jgi:hypothetical protein
VIFDLKKKLAAVVAACPLSLVLVLHVLEFFVSISMMYNREPWNLGKE